MLISLLEFAVDGLVLAASVSERLEDDGGAAELPMAPEERAERACRRRASMAARMAALLELIVTLWSSCFSAPGGTALSLGAKYHTFHVLSFSCSPLSLSTIQSQPWRTKES